MATKGKRGKPLVRRRRKSEPPIPSDPAELAKAGQEVARAIVDVLSQLVPHAPEATRARKDRSIRRAEEFYREHGVYKPKGRKLTKGRRQYITKLAGKYREVFKFDQNGVPQFLFAPAKSKGQKRALKEAKRAGFTVTRKGVIVPRDHAVAAKIVYDRNFKKYAVEKIPRRRKKGEAPRRQERRRDYFATFDELTVEERKFRRTVKRKERQLKPGQSLRFVVYGRHLSHTYFHDADALIRGFQHYLTYNKSPFDFVTNLSVVIVDTDETDAETRDRLFSDTFNAKGERVKGVLKGYRGR